MVASLALMDHCVHKIQSGRLLWMWGAHRFSVKDSAPLTSAEPMPHSCVLDVGHKSVSVSYARALHDRFRRLQAGLLSGDGVCGLTEDIEQLLREDMPMDEDMRTLVNLFQIRLQLLKPKRGH